MPGARDSHGCSECAAAAHAARVYDLRAYAGTDRGRGNLALGVAAVSALFVGMTYDAAPRYAAPLLMAHIARVAGPLALLVALALHARALVRSRAAVRLERVVPAGATAGSQPYRSVGRCPKHAA